MMTTLEMQPLPSGKVVNFSGAAVVQDQGQSVTAEVTPRLTGVSGETSTNGVTDEENSRMQVCWNQAMCKEMEIPEGYQSVAVLIIKWCKELDQLKSESEVRELEKLFRQSFNYQTQVCELDTLTKPQLQLNCALMNFIHMHNGPHNLLIIYYTGHGAYDEDGECLELHASRGYGDTSTPYPAQASWNRAESPLIEEADCDVLAIFDTCFASNIQKNGQLKDLRTYEFFAASGHDKMTAGPGPKSFTNALISSLKELLEECGDNSFTIRQLCEKVNLKEARRGNQSHVWSRFKRYDRYIALAPLKRTLAQRKEDFNPDQTRAFLSLRLPLTTERLTEEQISTIARAFSKAVKDHKAPVKSIDWVGLQSWRQTTSFAGVSNVISSALKLRNRYRQSLLSMRRETDQRIDSSHAQTSDDSPSRKPTRVRSDFQPTPPPSIPHKRRFSEGYYGASNARSKPLEDLEHRRMLRSQLTPSSEESDMG